MKKPAAAPTGREKAADISSSDSTESKTKEPSGGEELHGFTPASEIYSVSSVLL